MFLIDLRQAAAILRRQIQKITVISRPVIAFIALTQMMGVGVAQTQPQRFIGSWKVEVTFTNGQTRSCRFEARASGQGSMVVLLPAPLQVGSNQPAAGEWSQRDKDSVTFSGPVQFPVGNVGLERGILVLEGKFGAEGTITGEAKFFLNNDQERPVDMANPSKRGTFKATRITS